MSTVPVAGEDMVSKRAYSSVLSVHIRSSVTINEHVQRMFRCIYWPIRVYVRTILTYESAGIEDI